MPLPGVIERCVTASIRPPRTQKFLLLFILVRTILKPTYKNCAKIILLDHKSLHTTSKKEKRGGYSDQIQGNLCPTYDICLNSLLYIVYAYGLPFCVISILLSSIRVSLRAI